MENCVCGGVFLFSLSMSLTSCEDIFGHWEKPTPVIVTPGTDKQVEVTSVTLDKTELALTIGGIGGAAVQLTATVTPDNATDADVDWSSSDVSVATVDGSGLVTAVADGTATITAKAGDKTAECTVTVALGVESVTMGSYNCAKVYTSATNGYYIMCTDHSTSGNWSTTSGYSETAGGSTFTIGSKEQWSAIMTACGGTGYNCINTKCSSVTGWSNMGGAEVRYWSSTSSTPAWVIKADRWDLNDPNPSFPDNFHTRLISAF